MLNRRNFIAAGSSALSMGLSGCGIFIRDEELGSGDLSGRVLVEWQREDRFIYRASGPEALRFRPSFMQTAIVPSDIYTDGGSVPRVFWGIPGLSPWALGPAYIIHDWIFAVHRCDLPAPPEVKAITFEQSAIILAEVGRALIEAGLIDNDMLSPIVWAVRTRYARELWDRPGDVAACAPPPPMVRTLRAGGRIVADFRIPPKRRVLTRPL